MSIRMAKISIVRKLEEKILINLLIAFLSLNLINFIIEIELF